MKSCKKIITTFLLASISMLSPAQTNTELPIVIIIPSYNNKAYYKQNLDSVFYQKYDNYHVIYINDASEDRTGELVEAHIKQNNQEKRWTVINNEQRVGALCNIYRAVHLCDDNVIIVTLDGDDWLASDSVLTRINNEYASGDIWITYGQYQSSPEGKRGICRKLPEKIFADQALRTYVWVSSHLRTFYAWLFKKINEQDLKDNGEFFRVTWDQAMMLPMLEMAGFSHQKFISDILYIYNSATPLSDTKTALALQIKTKKIIRAKQPYKQIQRQD